MDSIKIEDVIDTSLISYEMKEAINLWGKLYADKAPWLKQPSDQDLDKVISLGIPSFVASEKARMATLEMKSEISSPDNISDDYISFLNDQYQKKVVAKIRTQLEYGIAKGGLVIKPYLRYDTEIMKATPEFELEFIQADDFFPIAFNGSGKMAEGAFIERKVEKDYTFIRLEHHKLNKNSVTIINRAFRNDNKSINNSSALNLGKEIPLTDVPEWSGIQPEWTVEDTDRLLFAYWKMPEANVIDPYSPLGVSGYSRAVKLIEEADKQYSRLIWEFEGGELAIDADRNVLRDVEIDEIDGRRHYVTELAKRQARLYRTSNIDVSQGELYQVFNPALRDVSLINGLNTILMRIEDVTALSRGTLSEITTEARTATELKVMKQRSFSANTDVQKSLEVALKDVVYIMNVYCKIYGFSTRNEFEVSFEWDDSLIVDADEELSKRIQLMQNGIESKLNIRMWYFGETEEQAKEALRKIDEENKRDMENDLMNDLGN